jgi:hypothetical protein
LLVDGGKTKKPWVHEVRPESLFVLVPPLIRISVANPVIVRHSFSHGGLFINTYEITPLLIGEEVKTMGVRSAWKIFKHNIESFIIGF